MLVRSSMAVVMLCMAMEQCVQASVRLNAMFSDGMVIQRETKAPIWGWAEPGESVSVAASWGATTKTVTAPDGSWSVKLQTPEAGGPHRLTVSGSNKLIIRDVLCGEVWFCSGQSNMSETLGTMTNDAPDLEYQPIVEFVRNEVRTSSDALLRQIRVPCRMSPNESQQNFKGTWLATNPENNPRLSGVAHFFGKELRRGLDVPVGLILCSWGATMIQPWIPESAYRANPKMSVFYDQERTRLKKVELALKASGASTKPKCPDRDRDWPGTMYNGMVESVIPYAIRGVIWYQGESNTGYLANDYAEQFSLLVSGWREAWGLGDFPFLFAQLAAFKSPNTEPLYQDGWATIRDQQRRSLDIPNTGMAVLTDVGEARNIHPRNKMDAGHRLALWALSQTYDLPLPEVSGPLYVSHSIEGGVVRIIFDHVGSGLMVGCKQLLDPAEEVNESLNRFQIAGENGVWKWADAHIDSTNAVEVSNAEVKEPRTVRYGWSANPSGSNLYNKEGLPASPFTTE